MLILVAVMLAVLVGVWLVFPLLAGKTGANEKERAVVAEEIEREIDELRKSSGARDEELPS
jgi:hypothetical protein